MPISDEGVVTVEEKKAFNVKLLRGPLGGRFYTVPGGVESGFGIVCGRDGAGQVMLRPVVYEVDLDHPSGSPVAVYAGFAGPDDVERWREVAKGG